MKLKSLTTAGFCLFFTLGAFAQSATHKCASHEIINHYENVHPGYKAQADEVYYNSIVEGNQKTTAQESYTLPVVVHCVWHDSTENLPDSVILNQIAALNADYQRLNADTSNMRDTFELIAGNPGVNFELAQFDEDGNATTGITRTYTTTDFARNNTNLFGSELPDLATLDEVKSATTGGVDPWDPSQFINIWITNLSQNANPSLLGYATPPLGLPNWPANSGTEDLGDGVVIQYQCFGRNNPNDLNMPNQSGGTDLIEVLGRTVTHEVGHYLGLRHISGDPTFFDPDGCTSDDGLDDTPNTDAQSQFDCDVVKNTCTDNIVVGATNLGDLPDFVENYMDYSSEECQNSFSFGQVGIIRSVIENERADLLTSIAFTGNSSAIAQKAFLENNINMYPNPTSGDVTLQLPDGEYTVAILNSLGQTIQSESFAGSTTFLDFSAMSPGIFFISVKSNGVVAVRKLIVK